MWLAVKRNPKTSPSIIYIPIWTHSSYTMLRCVQKNETKLLEIAQTKSIDEQSSTQDQKIVDVIDVTSEQDISYQLQNLKSTAH